MQGRIDPFIPFITNCARDHVCKQIGLGFLSKSDVDDHVQTLVQHVIEQWPRYAVDRCSREGFIIQIVSTRVISLVRKQNSLCRTPLREGQLQDWDESDELAMGLDSVDHLADRLDMAAALGCLTDREAGFVKLVAEEGLVAAAKKLDMTRATARGMVVGIRTKLIKAGIASPRWKSPRDDAAA